jgi:hypothetical protein
MVELLPSLTLQFNLNQGVGRRCYIFPPGVQLARIKVLEERRRGKNRPIHSLPWCPHTTLPSHHTTVSSSCIPFKCTNANSHLPRVIHFLRYKIFEVPKKFKNWPRPLFRLRTDHACHHKPNPSRDTVPFNIDNYIGPFFLLAAYSTYLSHL